MSFLQPNLIHLEEKFCIGITLEMSLSQDKTSELWQQFGPIIKDISNRIDENKISIQKYDTNVNPLTMGIDTLFERCAAVEVSKVETLPNACEIIVIPKSMYLEFKYIGKASDAGLFFNWVYNVYFPQSDFVYVPGIQFEVLSPIYQANSSDAEELIYIPVEQK